MSYTIHVDKSKCVDCGACVRECARHLPVYRAAQDGSNGVDCVGCLHCFAVCPQGAVAVEGIEPVAGGQARIETAALHGLLAWRRSCRRFLERPVESELLEQLVRAAAFVPSGGNSHAHRLTVVTAGPTRRALEEELHRIYRRKQALLGSPLLRAIGLLVSDRQTRAFLRDRTYLIRVSYLLQQMGRGEDPIFYRAPAIVLVHSTQPIPTPREDSVLAAYNMVLAAETLGLGSCFVSMAQSAINGSPACKRILGMDSREQVHAVVVLGHPAVRFHRAVPRERLRAIPVQEDPKQTVRRRIQR